MKQRNKMTKIK